MKLKERKFFRELNAAVHIKIKKHNFSHSPCNLLLLDFLLKLRALSDFDDKSNWSFEKNFPNSSTIHALSS